MLNIPGTWVARDSEEVTEVIANNTKYKEVEKNLNTPYLIIRMVTLAYQDTSW